MFLLYTTARKNRLLINLKGGFNEKAERIHTKMR